MSKTKKQTIFIRDGAGHLLLSQSQEQELKKPDDLGYWGTPEVLSRYSSCCKSMLYRIKDRVYQCSTCGSMFDLRSSIANQTPDDAWFYMGPHPIIHTEFKKSSKCLSRRVVAQAFKPTHLTPPPAFSPAGGGGFSTQMRYYPKEWMYRSKKIPYKTPRIEITEEERKGLERWVPFFKALKESPKRVKNLGLTLLFNLPNFLLLGSLGLIGIFQVDLFFNALEQHRVIVDYNVKRLKRKRTLSDEQEKELRRLQTMQKTIKRKMDELKKTKIMMGGTAEDTGWRTVGDKRIYVGPKETDIPTEFEPTVV